MMKTLLYSKRTIYILTLLLTSITNYCQTVINSETFDSGFGIWASGSSNVTRSTTAPYQGSNSVLIRGNSGMTLTSSALGLNILPYNKIDVKFFLRTVLNSNESITLQYRTGALATWQDVKVVVKGSGAPGSATGRDINVDNQYHAFYATLFDTDFTFSLTSQFRFVGNIGSNTRGVYLDNISIIGTTYNTITNGPGGITANLETWLRADKINGTGPIADNAVVNTWEDIGKGNDANVIDATNASITNRPVYKDNSTNNLNFNPVVFFNNNTSTTVSDLSGLTNRAEMNGTGGFYSHEQFIVIMNDTPSITSSLVTASDIYTSQTETGTPYTTDVTGFGLGDYSNRFNDEVISYCFGGSPSPTPADVNLRGYGITQAGTSITYNNLTTILNARNLVTVPTVNGMELYKDGLRIDNTEVGVPKFENSVNNRYWLGRSQAFNGSFGGRIAEVISYSARKNDATERRRIESYLAVKYGITLGINGTSLNYQNSSGAVIWDIAGNTGFNFDIAGIGRDDASQLSQKQSKSINSTEVLTIGLTDIATTNSANTAVFPSDRNYLMWGSNNGSMVDSGVDLPISLGPTTITTITEVVNRKWKVNEVNGDVPTTRVAIPTASFVSGLPALGPTDAYVMVVSTNAAFTTGLETVFMSTTGGNQTCLYDFDGTKYITFGVAHRATNPLHITLDGFDDYVRVDATNDLPATFTVMTWIRPNGANTSGTERTILSKKSAAGNGYQIVLQNDNKVRFEYYNGTTLRSAITNTIFPNAVWHNIAFTYASNILSIYIDGVFERTASMIGVPSVSTGTFSIGGQYLSKTSINNLFKGDIDELRMWDRVLTVTEIQFIMNQEIQESGTGTIGTIIPSTITKNDVSALLWNNLFAYYSMNSYIGTHLDDDSKNVNRGSLVIPDKISISAQTAPLPYESASNGNWETSATWTNSAIQDRPYSLSIINGTTPIDWNIVRTNHNITSVGNKTVLGLFVNSNILTATSASGSQTDGTKMEVTHYLRLDGKIDLVGRSQLVQKTGSDLDILSSGSLERDQQGQSNFYNYNYWGSPVGTVNTTTNNSNYTVATVLRDGTSPASPTAFQWTSGLFASTSTTPRTLSRYWINKFDNLSNNYANWSRIGETAPLRAGQGFTLKGTGAATATQNLVFVGKPNNGTITNTVGKSQLLLVGNPYPSALDAVKFINDNMGGSNDVITGSLYFWEHYQTNNTHFLKDYQGGYGIRNLTGGTPPSSTGLSTISVFGNTSKAAPKQFIPVGQGFFVIGNASGASTALQFNNSQRDFVKEDNAQSQTMYRTTASKSPVKDHWTDNSDTKIEAGSNKKIHIGFNILSNNFHRQVLLGFMDEKADSEINPGYDAPNIDGSPSDMYLLNKDQMLSIQGEGYFNKEASYPIAVKMAEEGKVSFVIDNLENFDADQNYFIYDAQTDTYNSIKKGPFEVLVAKGEDKTRFALHFTDKKAVTAIEQPTTDNNSIEAVFTRYNNTLNITNGVKDATIETVQLYNIQGACIKTWDIKDKTQFYHKLPITENSSEFYIVKIKTSKGIMTQKIIVK
ncbi:T9SS type A sorting domain-containing protein [Flavobacterium sp. K77]|uniref:LamG-like jellyroll fold domain-containing protein n=1 Tax=Flavobacterium sp. K77 TaxID=2910676 RepID=UPI001F32D862|nr:LamG-like jellyroll fold domain-containing protein [Flavobacterium sp. K77]MCF6141528.1 T9SS type A sorting domain-containing protein [Flavobacterium sp. K77]